MSEHKKRENIADVKLFEMNLAELCLGYFAYASLIFIFVVSAFTGKYFSDFSFLAYLPFVIFALYIMTSRNHHSAYNKLAKFFLTIALLVIVGGATRLDGDFYWISYILFFLPALVASIVFFWIASSLKK